MEVLTAILAVGAAVIIFLGPAVFFSIMFLRGHKDRVEAGRFAAMRLSETRPDLVAKEAARRKRKEEAWLLKRREKLERKYEDDA